MLQPHLHLVRMEKNLGHQFRHFSLGGIPLCCLKASTITWSGNGTYRSLCFLNKPYCHMAEQDLESVMTGTTVGNHLNTRGFLVAFQLCIRNGCNQVVNNGSVDKTDIAVARRTSYASSATPTLSLSLHTIQNLHSSKALFLLFFL